jgi:Ser/Thr protein kinase RdoA (MazF antagonist)
MSQYMWGDNETQYFYALTPELVLDAVEELGLQTTGRCLPLNSMENRVYEVEIEGDFENPSDAFRVAKFYRPGRWSAEQILEEHQFLQDLVDAELPVIAPIQYEGKTLFKLKEANLWYTLFPKKGGRAPDEMNDEQLEIIGRLLARLHSIGLGKQAKHRITLDTQSYGLGNLQFLLDNDFLPSHLRDPYKQAVETICSLSAPYFEKAKFQRVHGDCHIGNIIWRENFYLIDFDDMVVGPPVQDIWLILPGRDAEAIRQREVLLGAYETMHPFDRSSLALIEPLRALRFIHFSAWIAKRWEDPAFKDAFPQFESHHYWDIQLQDLNDQIRAIQMYQNNLY